MAMAILLATSCQSKTKPATISENASESTATSEIIEKLSPQDLSKYETAYFASGCFWCVEAIFESVRGVKEVISGYAGGSEENPTYEMVGSGQSSKIIRQNGRRGVVAQRLLGVVPQLKAAGPDLLAGLFARLGGGEHGDHGSHEPSHQQSGQVGSKTAIVVSVHSVLLA
jgi:hypothetical protein